MLILLLAGIVLSFACAAAIRTGFLSPIGKALGAVAAAIGITAGVTAGTVAAGLGASETATASVGMLVSASALLAGNAVIRKLIKKAGIQQRQI